MPDDEADRPAEREPPLLPHPPRARNTADFIVTAFSLTVCAMLMGIVVVDVALSLTGNYDTVDLTRALADVVATLISALIGYMAGRGQGRLE